MSDQEAAWEKWSSRLTDLSKPVTTYYEAFTAGWEAFIEACGGSDHLIKVTEDGWTLQHPITERVNAEVNLFECPMHKLLSAEDSEESLPQGLLRAWIDGGSLRVEPHNG